MISDKLRNAYAFHRSPESNRTNRRVVMRPASVALELARNDIANGKPRYGKRQGFFVSPKSDNDCQWTESISQGLRIAGPAHDIARSIRPMGWHTDDNGFNETVHGIVCRLPARNRQERFVAGMADPCNDDCGLIDFSAVYSDDISAAIASDRIAELYAESERDYRRAWQAGESWRNLGEEMSKTRKRFLQLRSDLRNLKTQLESACESSSICETLQAALKELAARRVEIMSERESLFSEFGNETAFNEG